MRGTTTIVISHDPGLIRCADRVLVISGGRIVEAGRHETLLEAGGPYATLYARDVVLSGETNGRRSGRSVARGTDTDGNLLRAHFDVHYKGTVTNSVTGLVARDDGSRMFIDDYVAQTSTLVRGSHHVTVPGYGIVFGETGRLVSDWNGTTPDESEDDDFVTFSAGLHGDPAQICDAMR